MKLDGPLPESFLRCLSPQDRKKLTGGAYSSPDEALRKASVKSERQLQDAIANLLRLRGVQFFSQRMDKRTRGRVGQPDFLFAVGGWSLGWGTIFRAYAWEIKMPGESPTKEQLKLHAELSNGTNCWTVQVIHSVDEALAELREIGL